MGSLKPLPIDPFLGELVDLARSRGAFVLVAEPGAGKTTRVPRALLLDGLAGDGEILVLEPRRLAVRLAARRVAEELGERVGERVGYRVRFEESGGTRTRLRFVTEGILARRLASDPELRGVAAVVFDELHERHLHADVSLALLDALRRTRRPELRLAAMSATLDAERVASFLDAPIVRVPGRAHPVEVRYLDEPSDRPLEQEVSAALRRLVRAGLEGDVLVFLPGAAEIRRAREACAPLAEREDLLVVALHGDLPAAEQDQAVRPANRRKVILSTNVAETSVTIEGVVAVIDSGLARVARHSPHTGLPTLQLAKISRASATQRAGRAGRTGPGACLRLYTRHDHDTRPAHDPPEILRADLAETVLTLREAGHDPATFRWLEAPQAAALDAAASLLSHLGALDARGAVTAHGRRVLQMPLHPRLATLLVAAEESGVGAEGAAVAALLGERELRLAARTRFDERPSVSEVFASDVLASFDAFEAARAEGLTQSALRRHELDPGAARVVESSRKQLLRHLARGAVAAAPGDPEAREELLLRAILRAFPDRVGKRRARGSDELVFAGGGSARLAPTSVVAEAELVVAVDVRDRPRGGAVVHAASAIEPEWLLEHFPERIVDARTLVFTKERERVEEITSLSYDGLVLDQTRRPAPPDAAATAALIEAALAAGLGRFCDAEALDALRRRVAFAATCTDGLEPLTDEVLRSLLVRACEGATSFAEIRSAGLLDLLRAQLGAQGCAQLERLAPATVPLPGRPRGAPVTYEADRAPWLESHLQDFFGLSDGPRVGPGQQAVVLHLLAPNGRAVQVTTDLRGFWERHYPALRKELMRRYPRHHFPEDPRTAEAKRFVRRRT